jgi:hypothetical protein
MGKKHIVGDANGWLNVRSEPSGTEIPLPEFTQVLHTATKSLPSGETRDYFTILEGAHRNRLASLRQTDGRSNLKAPMPNYTGSVQLKFDAKLERLTYKSVSLHAITAIGGAIPNGTHLIRLPDFPHKFGRPYLDKSRKAMSWFYIGPGAIATKGTDAFYLHPGQTSLGCVTIKDVDTWTALYDYLTLARHGDGLSVGTLMVTNSNR